MTRSARAMVAVAALMMSAAYALPLWRISLQAPQYPEGLGMLIHVDRIVGQKEGDLQSINGLNHYIGMRAIEPDSIPELRIMPVALGVLIVTGVIVAVLGRRRLFVAWAVALALLLVGGLADFWKWGYEYGHDLSPTAIIKMPGMTYQPPLIGEKKLLNFVAVSWPASGGWLLIGAAGLVGVALFATLRRARAPMLAIGLAGALGCGAAGPVPITVDVDACEYCRMTIVDARFGGEAITTTGKVHKFDSVECLASWVRRAPDGTVRGVYVMDALHPGEFVLADSAGFLRGSAFRSPMGRSLAAFASRAAADRQRAESGGTVATWREVLADAGEQGDHGDHAGHGERGG